MAGLKIYTSCTRVGIDTEDPADLMLSCSGFKAGADWLAERSSKWSCNHRKHLNNQQTYTGLVGLPKKLQEPQYVVKAVHKYFVANVQKQSL